MSNDAKQELHNPEDNQQPDAQIKMVNFHQKLTAYFTLDELRTLCFELGLDPDNFPPLKEGFVRELIIYLSHRGTLSQLISLCKKKRPHINWDDEPTHASSDLQPPEPFANPSELIKRLDTPGGAVRLDSRFYVKRDRIDDRLYQEITKDRGTTTTIRGPRQVGKTSLLIRANELAHEIGRQTVYFDLQEFGSDQLTSLDKFLYNLAIIIVDELELDLEEVEKEWRNNFIPQRKIRNLLEKYLLPTIETPFVLVMDEVDRLLDTPFHDDFFGLVRYWHNLRASKKLWERLHIVMVISTEPHLLIDNVTQSPFNVSLRLELTDFDRAQVCYLDEQYGTAVCHHHLDKLMTLLGGHPFLTQQALYVIATENLTWAEFETIAPTDVGPFADHLNHYLELLRRQPILADAMKSVIHGQKCSDKHILRHLLRAGLIRKEKQKYVSRCDLYYRYLKNSL